MVTDTATGDRARGAQEAGVVPGGAAAVGEPCEVHARPPATLRPRNQHEMTLAAKCRLPWRRGTGGGGGRTLPVGTRPCCPSPHQAALHLMATCPWLSAGHRPRGVSLAAQLSGCVGAGPPSLPATPAPALRACSGHSQTPPPPRLTVLGPRAPVCPAPSFWQVFPPRTAPRPGPAERGSRQWGRGLRVAGSRTPAGPGRRDLWPPSCHVLSVTIWGGSAGEEDMSCAAFPGSSLSTANWATCRFFFQGGRGPRQARAGGPAVGGPRPCLWSWRRDRWHLLSVLRAPCSG